MTDAAQARDFYVRHLLATVVFDAGWHVSLRLGGDSGPEVAFSTPNNGQDTPVTPGSLSLYVEVDDVDAAYAQVRATDAPLQEPPTDKPWGDRSFTFTDPFGVRVYMFSPRPLTADYAEFAKD